MTFPESVLWLARQLMAAKLPLIEGVYQPEPGERNPLAVWDAADPFKRSEFMHTSLWVHQLRFLSHTIIHGPCLCLQEVGLKPEQDKHMRHFQCQRCGGL